MKLAVVAASLLASVNSQIVHNTAKKLDARCLFEDNIEKLVIDIPYPGAEKANILDLAAGICDEVSFKTAEDNGAPGRGRMDVGADKDMVHLVIPIDACDIRGDVYKTPTVERSYGLIKPTANVTFGQNIAGQDIIFRYLPIAAECGTRTSYTVEFEYNDVKSADTEGCTDVDGVCVFPAYGEEAVFEIKEYTGNDYDVEVDDGNRAKTAGEPIFLSMQVTDLPADLKFAVTECILKQKDDTSGDGITLLNPGEVHNATDPASKEPSCKIPEIDLSGTYDGFTRFNFQHILFLLNATADTNSFTLQCTIEVCSRDDASSVCNRAAAVCLNTDEQKFDYICEEACSDVGHVCEVSIDNQPSCSEGNCPASSGGSMMTVNNEQVCTIAGDNNPYKSSVIMRDLYWADYPSFGSKDYGKSGDTSENLDRAIDDDWSDDDYTAHGGDLVATIFPAVIVNTVMVRARKGGWSHRYKGMNAELNFGTADSVFCQPRNEHDSTYVDQNKHNPLYFDCTRAVVASTIKLYKNGLSGSNVDTLQLNELLLAYQATCTCDHGSAAVGTDCTVANAICVSCDVGYILSGTECVKVFGCDELSGADYLSALEKLHSGPCSPPWSSVPVGFGSHSELQSGVDSTNMRVWYFVSSEQMSWPAGKTFCENHGLTMAQIHTDAEWDDTMVRMSETTATLSYKHFYMSAHHFGPGSGRDAYKWANGQKMCYDKWESGEPNDRASPYGQIYMRYPNGGWDDSNNSGQIANGGDPYFVLCEHRCTEMDA